MPAAGRGARRGASRRPARTGRRGRSARSSPASDRRRPKSSTDRSRSAAPLSGRGMSSTRRKRALVAAQRPSRPRRRHRRSRRPGAAASGGRAVAWRATLWATARQGWLSGMGVSGARAVAARGAGSEPRRSTAHQAAIDRAPRSRHEDAPRGQGRDLRRRAKTGNPCAGQARSAGAAARAGRRLQHDRRPSA